MSTKRYIIFSLPFAHMNGKLDNESIKLPNYDPMAGEKPAEVSFFYGYRHKNNLSKSLYAKRINARNLSEKPYTQGEQDNKSFFTLCVQVTKQNYTRDKKAVADAFKKQNKCTSPYHFAIGQTILNGGIWPF